jgi:hypothetical protein
LAIQEVSGRAIKLVSGRLFLFVTPILAASLFFRGLIWIIHRTNMRNMGWLELVLLFLVCMPLALFGEAVVAALYLGVLRGDGVGLREALDVGKFPGVVNLISRVVGLSAFWFVPAIVVGSIASLLVKALMHLIRPDAGPVTTAKGVGHGWVIIALVLYAAVLSRYSFVMPMLSLRRSGGGETFRAAVRRIKGYWFFLAVVGVAEYLAVHVVYQWSKRPEAWRGGRQAAVLAELFFSAVLATYVAAFKTGLIVEIDASE